MLVVVVATALWNAASHVYADSMAESGTDANALVGLSKTAYLTSNTELLESVIDSMCSVDVPGEQPLPANLAQSLSRRRHYPCITPMFLCR